MLNAQRESRGMLRWKTGGVDVTHLKVFEKSRLGGILVTVRIANKIFQRLLYYRPVLLEKNFWLAMAETCHWGDSKKLCSPKWEQWGPKMQYWKVSIEVKWSRPGDSGGPLTHYNIRSNFSLTFFFHFRIHERKIISTRNLFIFKPRMRSMAKISLV